MCVCVLNLEQHIFGRWSHNSFKPFPLKETKFGPNAMSAFEKSATHQNVSFSAFCSKTCYVRTPITGITNKFHSLVLE